MLTPVILSGGSGTRLWPLSRDLYPKQFLPLTGSHTMFQETVRRLGGLAAEPPVVVCNEHHRFIVAEQLRQLGTPATAIVLEPVGRNTAPAVAVAALAALRAHPGSATDPVLLVMPADHVLRDSKPFRQAVELGFGAAAEGKLW
jgi:mannose-1-phosphate guanylyltransferase